MGAADEERKDMQKLEFMLQVCSLPRLIVAGHCGMCLQAMDMDDPCRPPQRLPQELKEVVEWMAERTPQQIREHREKVVQRILSKAAQYRESGACAGWLKGCDPSATALGG